MSDGIAPVQLLERFCGAVDRIRRRLGGLRHADVRQLIEGAFDADPTDESLHLRWIERLLEWYYDPMYDHQLTAKQGRVVQSGNRATIRAYLTDIMQR
jgi:tRNA 2-selenouridine synthase